MSKSYSNAYYTFNQYRYWLKDFLSNQFQTWRTPARLFDAFHSLEKDSKVLDVGCGKGELLARMHNLRPELELTGVDITDAPLVDSEIKRITANALALPFPDNSFNLVVCRHVIEHIPDSSKLFSELARVVKKGGKLYIECPDVRSTRTRLATNFYDDPTHVRPYTQTALKRLADEYGIQTICSGRWRNMAICLLGIFYFPVALLYRDYDYIEGFWRNLLGTWIWYIGEKRISEC